jgi:hypothetical protein
LSLVHFPDVVVQYDTVHTHELVSEYPELHSAQSPSWSHFVHPVLFPLEPQHLPPLQLPDEHPDPEEHPPPSAATLHRPYPLHRVPDGQQTDMSFVANQQQLPPLTQVL